MRIAVPNYSPKQRSPGPDQGAPGLPLVIPTRLAGYYSRSRPAMASRAIFGPLDLSSEDTFYEPALPLQNARCASYFLRVASYRSGSGYAWPETQFACPL